MADAGSGSRIEVGGLWGGEDLWHRPDLDDPAYRESYYFDFHGPETGIAGFTSVGWKPGRGVLGATTVVFTPSGAWMTQAQRETEGDHPLLDVGGLAYRRSSDKLGYWDLELTSQMVPVPEIGTQAMTPSDTEPIEGRLHVSFSPSGPVICTVGDDYRGAFDWHLEQAGDASGEVVVGSAKHVRFSGPGHRDRSWGARKWTTFPSWIYLAGHTENASVNFWGLQHADGRWAVTGWLQRTGRPLEVMKRCRILPHELFEAGDEKLPATTSFLLEGTDTAVTGTVRSARLVQLGFRSRHGSCRLDRGLGIYKIDGVPGVGQVEYQQQLGVDAPGERWSVNAG